jgi:hypothetical protein
MTFASLYYPLYYGAMSWNYPSRTWGQHSPVLVLTALFSCIALGNEWLGEFWDLWNIDWIITFNSIQFSLVFQKGGVDFKAPNNVAEEVSQSPAAPTSKWENKTRLSHPFAGCWKCRSCSPNRHTHCMNPLNSYPRDKLWIGVIWHFWNTSSLENKLWHPQLKTIS